MNVINPWRKETVVIDVNDITQDRLDEIYGMLSDDEANEWHSEMTLHMSPEETLALLISQIGEEKVGVLWFS